MGPLVVHPVNPRYFMDADGRLVYLTGSNEGYELQDNAWDDYGGPVIFDYDAYLDFLVAKRHNYIRMWCVERTRGQNDSIVASPMPWKRTGPGTANDGLPKFDLSQFDPAYFDRLKTRVEKARAKGIYVGIMLFQGVSIWEQFGSYEVKSWFGHMFHKNNNINGINGDPNNDGAGYESHSLQIPQITALQEAYVQKVIDTVNEYENVLYEIANEDVYGTVAWQQHMIDWVHAYQNTKPHQHPVGMSWRGGPGSTNAELYSSSAEWVSPKASLTDPFAADGSKVSLLDTDHFAPFTTDARFPWRAFLRGHQPVHLDKLHQNLGNGTSMDGIRNAMGRTRMWAERIDLAHMTPQGGLASSGYCLANPGQEYLAYQPGGGALTLTLSPGTYRVEWFRTSDAATFVGASVGGGSQTLTPPFGGDALVYLQRTLHPVPGRVEAEDYHIGGYQDSTPGNLGGYYRFDAVDIEPTSDAGGGYNVGWIDAGEWLAFEVDVARAGTYGVVVRLASGLGGIKKFHLEVDGVNQTGSVSFGAAAGWQSYSGTIAKGLRLTQGAHVIRFVAETSGLNLNWLEFHQYDPVPGRVEAEDYKIGGEGAAYHDTTPGNAGGAYRPDDVDVEACDDAGGGWNVGWIGAGEWLSYFIEAFQSESFLLKVRVSSGVPGTKLFHLEIDGVNVTGSLSFTDAAGWQSYVTVSSTVVNLAPGFHTLKFVAETGGINLNYIDFDPVPATAPGVVEAERYRAGGPGVGYIDTTPGNTGRVYRDDDADLALSTEGVVLGWIADGEKLGYNIQVQQTGTYDVIARVASPSTATKEFHLRIAGVNISGPITFGATGGWGVFQDVAVSGVQLTAGSHLLVLVVDHAGFNLNRLTFVLTSAGGDPPGAGGGGATEGGLEDGVVAGSSETADDRSGGGSCGLLGAEAVLLLAALFRRRFRR